MWTLHRRRYAVCAFCNLLAHTWFDFHGKLVRVYACKGIRDKVRVELIESPNRFVADLLDSAEDAKKKLSEGFTCVEVVLPAGQMEFAMKLSKENDANARDAELTNLRIAE